MEEQHDVGDERTPLDLALDVLVFAPVGLAVSARELLPKLVERGRSQVTGQMATARVVGQFAVQQGQTEAAKAFTRARQDAQARIEQLVRPPATPSDAPPAPSSTPPRPASRPRPATRAPSASRPRPAARAPSPSRTAPADAPAADTLAIPDYDSLSASQVVPRLQGLSASELEAVRIYESAHRGRKTILGRITQLQSR
jgi:hypothetical protein